MSQQAFVISWADGAFIPEKSAHGYTQNLLLAKKWRTLASAERFLDRRPATYASQCRIYALYTEATFDELLARFDAKGTFTALDRFQLLWAANLTDESYGVLLRTLLGPWTRMPLGLSRAEAAMTAAEALRHQGGFKVLRSLVLRLTSEAFAPWRSSGEPESLGPFRPDLRQVQVFELINPWARQERAYERRECTTRELQAAPTEIDYLLSPEQLTKAGTDVPELVEATMGLLGKPLEVTTHETRMGQIHRMRVPGYRPGAR